MKGVPAVTKDDPVVTKDDPVVTKDDLAVTKDDPVVTKGGRAVTKGDLPAMKGVPISTVPLLQATRASSTPTRLDLPLPMTHLKGLEAHTGLTPHPTQKTTLSGTYLFKLSLSRL
jgi:hypothetical protein